MYNILVNSLYKTFVILLDSSSVKSAEIQCKTSALPLGQESGRKKRSLVEGDIEIIIDGVLLSKDDLTFSYEEDPFVENVHPRRSIARYIF